MGDEERAPLAEDRYAAMRHAMQVTKGGDPDAVIALLDSRDADVRLHAIVRIRRKGIVQALSALTRRLPEEDDYLREAVMGALADLRQEQSRETFVELLSDTSPTVRRLALRGLAALGDVRAVEAATGLYSSGDRFSKYEALDALAMVPDQRAEHALRSLATTERSWYWRRRVRKAIRAQERATL
jgi:HEAT repeat protein